jgi:hypothetical protein
MTAFHAQAAAEQSPVERCHAWSVCPMCLADIGYSHSIAWQEGRDSLADLEPAQMWVPKT